MSLRKITSMGRLEIIMGCMFSGKSSEIIKIINSYTLLNKKIMAITHSIDTRYNKSAIIVTHDKIKYDCISTSNLLSLKEKDIYKDADVVVIEEAQFFDDLYNFVIYCLKHDNKIVIVAGLDGDYKQEPFGDILKLIPHAERVKKLSALCLLCNDGTLASFTKRKISCESQTFVGSSESYIAVCRKHL